MLWASYKLGDSTGSEFCSKIEKPFTPLALTSTCSWWFLGFSEVIELKRKAKAVVKIFTLQNVLYVQK